MPISSWFKDSLNDYIKDILLSKNAKIYDYLNISYVKEIVNNHDLVLEIIVLKFGVYWS